MRCALSFTSRHGLQANTATVSPLFQANYTVYHDRSFWLGVHWLIYYPPGQIPDQEFPNFALRGTPMLFIVIKYKLIKIKHQLFQLFYMTVKFGQLNSVTKIGLEPQKRNIYGERQSTLFSATKETRKF
jgi:hypothetical protein